MMTVEELRAWKQKLLGWRSTLVEELHALPPARTSKKQGVRDNLTHSIQMVDGYNIDDTGYSLHTPLSPIRSPRSWLSLFTPAPRVPPLLTRPTDVRRSASSATAAAYGLLLPALRAACVDSAIR